MKRWNLNSNLSFATSLVPHLLFPIGSSISVLIPRSTVVVIFLFLFLLRILLVLFLIFTLLFSITAVTFFSSFSFSNDFQSFLVLFSRYSVALIPFQVVIFCDEFDCFSELFNFVDEFLEPLDVESFFIVEALLAFRRGFVEDGAVGDFAVVD